MQKLLPFASLAGLFVILSLASPHFLTQSNLSSVIRQTAVIDLIALGMTLVIITGGIDLSVGSILALASLFGAMILRDGHSIPFAILVSVLVGAICGLLNGAVLAHLKISPFVVTLGTMEIFRGLALVVSRGLPVSGMPISFSILGAGTLWKIPIVLWILIVCAFAMHFLLENTKMGRYAFAIGSNVHAAHYSGVPIQFHLVMVYAVIGLLTGLAGMIEASRLMSGQPTAGQGYELQAIAAVVIGGGSLSGGEGTLIGTLVGATIMGLLANGSDLLGVNPYWQQVIVGIVIIAAVWLDMMRRKAAQSSVV